MLKSIGTLPTRPTQQSNNFNVATARDEDPRDDERPTNTVRRQEKIKGSKSKKKKIDTTTIVDRYATGAIDTTTNKNAEIAMLEATAGRDETATYAAV